MADIGPAPNQAHSNESILMTMEEFAATAGVSINTARYWRATGQGPRFVRIGRRVMARRVDVAKWVDEQFEAAS